MKVIGEFHVAIPWHMVKISRYTLNGTVGRRHRRSGSFNKDKFLVPASNPATFSRLSNPIPVIIKNSLWNAEKDHTGPFFCLPQIPTSVIKDV